MARVFLEYTETDEEDGVDSNNTLNRKVYDLTDMAFAVEDFLRGCGFHYTARVEIHTKNGSVFTTDV